MLSSWIESIKHIQFWGYIIAFLAAFLETVPAIGLLVPGQTIVVLVGFLAHQGILDLWLVFGCTIFGAILGDWLGYMLGRKYGTTLFSNNSSIISDTKKLLHTHPWKTLVFGRFNSLTRAFAPFTAGATRLSFRRFMFANICGGILWGTFWVLIGYIFGASFSLVSGRIDIILMSAIVVGCTVFFGYYYMKRHWGVSRRMYWLAVASITGLAIFLLLVLGINHPITLAIDQVVDNILSAAQTPVLTAFFLVCTSLLQPAVVSIFSLLALLFLIAKKEARGASLFLVSVFGAIALNTGMKYLVARARPSHLLWQTATAQQGAQIYGFPSGHALVGVAFFGAIILTCSKLVPWRRAFIYVCITLAALVAFSRLYLGVHWFSDVLGGVALGVFWLALVFLVSESWNAYRTYKRTVNKAKIEDASKLKMKQILKIKKILTLKKTKKRAKR